MSSIHEFNHQISLISCLKSDRAILANRRIVSCPQFGEIRSLQRQDWNRTVQQLAGYNGGQGKE